MTDIEEAPLIGNTSVHEGHERKKRRDIPEDEPRLYWCYIFLGFGLLTPWSSFLSAVDYIEALYPERDPMRWLTAATYPPMLCTLMINSVIPFKHGGHLRIAVGFLCFVIGLSSVPIVDKVLLSHHEGTDASFALLLLSGGLVGAANGLVEGSVLGLTLFLPSQCYQAYTSGAGASAVFVTLIRVLIKAAATDTPNSLSVSASIFFLISAAICFVCCLIQLFVIMPHPLFQSSETTLSLRAGERTGGWKFHWKVFCKLSVGVFCLIFLYFITTVLFPGVPSDVENAVLGDWYGILLVLLYSIGDFVSRLVPNCYVFTYLSIRCFNNPAVISSLILLLGLSNGYGTLCAFALGQKSMQSIEHAFVGGNFLVVALILGINFGALGSIGWAHLIGH